MRVTISGAGGPPPAGILGESGRVVSAGPFREVSVGGIRDPEPHPRPAEVGPERDVDLEWEVGATVDDLVVALHRDGASPWTSGGGGLTVDGLFHPGDRLLDHCAIHEGSVLGPPGGGRTVGGRPPGPDSVRWEVLVLTGSEAGLVVGIGSVPLVMGSHPRSRATVRGVPTSSPRRCRLVDLGPRGVGLTVLDGGVRIEGHPVSRAILDAGSVIDLGPTRLLIRRRPRRLIPAERGPGTGGSGTGRITHTPPPTSRLASPDPPTAPDPPPEPVRPAGGPGPSALLAPLGMGVFMVVAMGNPLFALLATLGPLTLLGNRLEARIRHRRAVRRWREAVHRSTGDHGRSMAEWRRDRRRRAWEATHLPGDPPVGERGVDPTLWVRRDGGGPLGGLVVGVGAVPTPGGDGGEAHSIGDLPVTVDLSPGRTVGVAGPTSAVGSLVRSLVMQAALGAAPSELEIVFAGGPGGHAGGLGGPAGSEGSAGPEGAVAVMSEPPGWATWLPHLGDGGPVPPGRVRLVVHDRPGVGGRLVVPPDPDGSTAHLVTAAGVARLPSHCDQVVDLAAGGGGAWVWEASRSGPDLPVVATGINVARAERVARSLARLSDPRRAGGPRRDPGGLLSLVDREGHPTGWDGGRPASGAGARSLVAVVGTDGEGRTVELDLVAAGPHALVAGTTGSGKSEFLRTWICSLALAHPPDTLGFVLIDYKGGAAFDRCADLPHTLGTVTDLDRDEAARALIGLEAELRHRELRLRELGAGDVAELDPGVVPSLVLVVDEFAGLREDLPGFVDGLVALAQRGRSLGVHLVLATQRPSGAVSADIAANMSLRIALRVQDPADSVDVVGTPVAASLPRSRPGSAVVAGIAPQPVVMRAAPVCGPAPEAPDGPPPPVTVTPRERWSGPSGSTPSGGAPDGGTELDRIVEILAKAAAERGSEPQPRPWLDPLPGAIPLEALDVDAGDGALLVALGDDPRRRRQEPVGWDPTRGNLMLVGRPGSGPEMAVDSLVARAVERWGEANMALHVIGTGGGRRPRPHPSVVGGDVNVDDLDLVELVVRRHLRVLGDRLRRRPGGPGATGGEGDPVMFLVLEGCGSVVDRLSAPDTLDLLDGLKRLVTEGPGVGIHTVVTSNRIAGVPVSWQASMVDRWAFDLADPLDRQTLGCPPVPADRPGRARTLGGLEIQVAAVPEPLVPPVGPERSAVSGGGAGHGVIGPLPDVVDTSGLEVPSTPPGGGIRVPLGVGGEDRGPLAVELRPGETFVILGRRGSGRSTALELFRRALTAVCTVDSPGGGDADGRPSVVIVDDADSRDSPPWAPAPAPDGGGIVVVAADPDVMGRRFAHWLRDLPRGRGLFLGPAPIEDGELLGTRLPRWRGGPPRPGRGWLVTPDGCVRIQLARP